MVEIASTSFAALLRQYRVAAGLTQEELAERASLSGRAISDLERGVKLRPYPHTVQRLVQALGLTEEAASLFRQAVRRQSGAGTDGDPQRVAIHTFLVADLRGYTAFTHERGDEAAAELTGRFAAIVREVVSVEGGEVIELRGDEVLVSFVSARGALRAAVTLQDRLLRETTQGPILPLRAGVGLDAGEAVPVEGGYRGGALNLAARLCALAGPGEVFASEGVVHLARAMEELVYLDRGEVQLKGLPDPVQVIQVGCEGAVPGAAPRFPVHPTQRPSLPVQPTLFVGRQQEITDIRTLLDREEVRLLTLTGPGGVGKTRLALRAVEQMQERFPDGIVFVALAALTDPALLPPTVATALPIKEMSGEANLEIVAGHLRDKRLLLVLDNFEHLLPSANIVSSLLALCPQLTVLVTSRAVLHLAAEREYPVLPLPTPLPGHLPDVDTLGRYDAIQLFLQRAQAVKPEFQMTRENAAAIAEISCRLDGLPLAIELAVTRLRLLPPQALCERLADRLNLLTGGPRDVPARQQTLRNTLDWSYSLLSPDEQALFTRLAVFAGGCPLDAVEAVCASRGELDVLAGIGSLVEQSLVRQVGEQPRFDMLETVREYAQEQLTARGERDELQERHAAYFLTMAERAEPELLGPNQRHWLDALEREQQNLRAALAWSWEARSERGLHLAAALWRFWAMHDHLTEGRRWLDAMLTVGETNGKEPPALRAKALNGAGNLARRQGDIDSAKALFEESLRMRRDLGFKKGVARSLGNLGVLAEFQGAYERASELFREALQICRELGDTRGIALSLRSLGGIAERQGAYGRAQELYEESLGLMRELGNPWDISGSLRSRGAVAERQDEDEAAGGLYKEALRLSWECGDKSGLASALVGLAAVAGFRQEYDRVAQLLGAAATVWTSSEVPPGASDQEHTETVSRDAREVLGVGAYEIAWNRGGAMTLEQAVTYALEHLDGR